MKEIRAGEKLLAFCKILCYTIENLQIQKQERTMLNYSNGLFISIMPQYQIFQHTVTDDSR